MYLWLAYVSMDTMGGFVSMECPSNEGPVGGMQKSSPSRPIRPSGARTFLERLRLGKS